MTRTDATLKRFRHLNVWKRGDVRAPHKPLLVLLALGRLQAGSDRLLSYDEIEHPLTRLLQEFGPPRKSPHPELPFYHLQSDSVWEIEDRVPLRVRKGSRNPLKSDLRKFQIAGGFPDDLCTGRACVGNHPKAGEKQQIPAEGREGQAELSVHTGSQLAR